MACSDHNGVIGPYVYGGVQGLPPNQHPLVFSPGSATVIVPGVAKMMFDSARWPHCCRVRSRMVLACQAVVHSGLS